MLKTKFVVPALILTFGMALTTVSYGKPEYTKKEKKGCAYCHVTARSKELNEVGKCYEKNDKSLEGCKEPEKK